MDKLKINAKNEILNKYFEGRKEIIEKHYAGARGLDCVTELSDLTDETIKALAEISFPNYEKVTIVVLGGYGRRELCFKSDIDISLVFEDDDIENLKAGIESFYYSLLDMKVDIGFSPRDIKTFIELAEEDLTVATSLLQGRFLFGNKQIYDHLNKEFKKLIRSKRRAYIDATLKTRKMRYKSTGSSIFMMEPHVKEGEGGLRDFHEVFWIAKVLDDVDSYYYFVEKNIILDEEYRELMKAYDFILKIRNQMHLICNKKCDVLVFPLQEEVAKRLGYAEEDFDEDQIRESVENMMKFYYLNAKSINTITKRILKALTETHEYEHCEPIDDVFAKTTSELDIISEEKFESDPLNVLKAFKYFKEYGLDFSPNLEYLIRKNQKTVKENIKNPEQKKLVREIFSNVNNLPKTLRKMQEFFVLDSLIPEFGFQRCHFQYDAYHKYTTDAHAIKAVEMLENLYELNTPEKKKMYELYKEIKRKDLLIWAIFLHDIGKGHKADHSVLGAEMAFDIMKRFDYTDEEAELVSYLVRHHLEMAKISQRRNIHEPKVIESFVQTVKNPEILKMLTVLTWCDANAVGPNTWNDWKNSLLWELFNKTMEIFEEEIPVDQLNQKRIEEKRKRLKALLSAELGEERAEFHLNRISDYYLLSTTSDDAFKHLMLEEELLKTGDIQFYFEKKAGVGFSNIDMAISDIKNPLLIITGALSAMNINILSVYSFMRKDGVSIVNLKVSTSALEAIDESRFQEFLDLFNEILNGNISIEDLKITQRGFKAATIPPPTFVKIDNKLSDSYTIFDISAEDRIGLLFDIIKVFDRFNIYVHIAKVSTQGERARDAFYVRDLNKNKIYDEELLSKIQGELLKVLKS